MIKCKCVKCCDEAVFDSHKSAWMDGWDFVGTFQYCGDCSVMPMPNKKVTDLPLTIGNSDSFRLSNE